MVNIVRKFQKIFANTALNNGKFGSLEEGSKITSSDPEVIQDLPAYEQGWNDAVISGEQLPALEELQGLQYKTDYQLAYMLQKGIPEWDSQTDYHIGDISRDVAGTILYKSITDDNVGNALTDVVNWEFLSDLANSDYDKSNVIINGGFDVAQRGTSTTSFGGSYNLDRWKALGSGITGTISQEEFTLGQTDVPGEPKNFFRADITVAGTGFDIAQRIESARTLAGETCILDFYAKADAAISVTPSLEQSFGTGGTPSASVGHAGSVINITTSWQRFTQTFSLSSISGKTLGTDDNDYLQLLLDMPDSIFQFDLSNVSLRLGSAVVDFEKESYEKIFLDCIPFFERINYGAFGIISVGAIQSSNSIFGKIEYFSKRRIPTITSSFFTINGWGFRSSNVIRVLNSAPLFVDMERSISRIIYNTPPHGAGVNGASGTLESLTGGNGIIDIEAEL